MTSWMLDGFLVYIQAEEGGTHFNVVPHTSAAHRDFREWKFTEALRSDKLCELLLKMRMRGVDV